MTKRRGKESKFAGIVYSSEDEVGTAAFAVVITNAMLTIVSEENGVCEVQYGGISSEGRKTAWITRENLDKAMKPINMRKIRRLIRQHPHPDTKIGLAEKISWVLSGRRRKKSRKTK